MYFSCTAISFYFYFFFFSSRRRHTRYWRDWSSDVCSSDLLYADGGDSNEIVQLYESATRLSPHDAQFWADLGDGYDWAGRSHDALDAFQYARHLFPNSPEINWRLANFYVRAGNIPDALHTLRMVLLEDGSTARRVFTLARNATRDKEAILE